MLSPRQVQPSRHVRQTRPQSHHHVRKGGGAHSMRSRAVGSGSIFSVSVRFEIATLRTAESVNLMQRLSGDLCAHPNEANRFSFNPHGWLPGIALSVVQDVTNFHFTLALRAFWSVVHSEGFCKLDPMASSLGTWLGGIMAICLMRNPQPPTSRQQGSN